jgi:DNA processing protein
MPIRPLSSAQSPAVEHQPDLIDFAALSMLPAACRLTTSEALRSGEPPGQIFARLAAQHWPTEPGARAELRAKARAAVDRSTAAALTPIAWSDPQYPAALAAIIDPPPVLWTRGDLAAFDAMLVAIVGSRAASPYALSVATSLATDLAARGLVVVSGLARGVDSAAHRGALDGDGRTIAVLGSGADIVYPSEHAPLANAIAERGLVVSELVPGTPPMAHFFPLRNRIISGLSRAVVVIEASHKSGSLITARCALEQGRDVLAVPGSILSGRNRGAHALLRDGAKIVESADDILEELGMRTNPSAEAIARAGGGVSSSASFSGERPRDPILACLEPGEPSDLDEIAERSGLAPARLLPRLLELELSGAVARVGGGRFLRIGHATAHKERVGDPGGENVC